MDTQRITQLPQPPQRREDSHKGTYGKVLLVGGSVGMSGAAALAGMAALRGGAGLVFVAAPESVLPVVASFEPSYLTIPLPQSAEGRVAGKAQEQILDLLPDFDAAAIGPGIGRSKKLTELVRTVFIQSPAPLVIDADALNALADVSAPPAPPLSKGGQGGVATLPSRESSAARILTPHPGEFARLTGSDTKTVQSRREELAVEYAARNEVTLVLKGYRTIITDGKRLAENTTGNAGLATGGTGDVLTGLITSLLGQGMDAFEAAQLGAHLHGLAGDLAAEQLSQPGMIASDLPRFLPEAWRRLFGGSC